MRHAGPLPSCTGAGGPVARARRPLSTSLTSISMVDAAASSSSPPPKMHPLRPSLRASAGPRDAPRDRAISARRQATPRSDDDKDGEAAARNASSSSATTSQNRRRRRPRLRALVVVEGPSDARAVLRAVDLSDGCHSLGGATWARNRGAMDQLVEAAARALLGSEDEGGGGKGKAGGAVVLLLDPDAPGRVARGEISRELCRRIIPSSQSSSPPPLELYHAFVPAHKCTAARAVRGKSAGDVGIEHASADAVVAALRAARRHRGEEGATASCFSSSAASAASPPPPPLFSMRQLEEARLATSFDAGSQQKKQKKESEGEGGDAASPSSSSPSQKTSDRRRRFCDALGLGPCTGAQLLRALNEWGLTREDWEAGMRAAEATTAEAEEE